MGGGGIFSYISSITMILGRYLDQSCSTILTENYICLRQHFLNEAIFSHKIHDLLRNSEANCTISLSSNT